MQGVHTILGFLSKIEYKCNSKFRDTQINTFKIFNVILRRFQT
jgi:hypothetical protein